MGQSHAVARSVHAVARFAGARGTPVRLAALGAAMLLVGCGNGADVSRSFGLTRDAPDEFQVTTRAPLSMPPDFSLRPPHPGAQRPQELSTSRAAEAALVPQTALGVPGASTSTGQQALVAAAGPAAPADIRKRIDAEASLDQPSESLTDRLMFWKPTPLPGVVVDPQKEAQRLRANAALGQGLDAGDTPIIQRGSSSGGGIFGSLF